MAFRSLCAARLSAAKNYSWRKGLYDFRTNHFADFESLVKKIEDFKGKIG